jgi:hypothetical protein
MVSKAREDFPEPDNPVITTSLLRGISMEMFLRLCCLAPRILMKLELLLIGHWSLVICHCHLAIEYIEAARGGLQVAGSP